MHDGILALHSGSKCSLVANITLDKSKRAIADERQECLPTVNETVEDRDFAAAPEQVGSYAGTYVARAPCD